jgi:hypothetical protein
LADPGFPQQNQQQQPHYLQSNESWSTQGVNYGHPPGHPANNSQFQQMNMPSHGPSHSDSRGPHYYNGQQIYPPQDKKRQQQFSETPPQLSSQGSSLPQDYDYPPRGPYDFHRQDPRISQFPRRSLPSDSEMMPLSAHDGRKRLPLRRYYSEERDCSIQEDFDRVDKRGLQAYESVYGDEQGSPVHLFDQRARYEKSRRRSSSLDSHHERVEQYAKSRSCSLERNRDLAIEEYEKEHRKKMLSRTQSQGDEYSHEERRKHMHRSTSLGHSTLPSRSMIDSSEKVRKSDIEKDRHRTSAKETTRTASDHKQPTHKQRSSQPSLPQNDNLKRAGNYCPQHKKFTSAVGSSAKSSRRQLPKEPALLHSDRKKLEKSLVSLIHFFEICKL